MSLEPIRQTDMELITEDLLAISQQPRPAGGMYYDHACTLRQQALVVIKASINAETGPVGHNQFNIGYYRRELSRLAAMAIDCLHQVPDEDRPA